ncbi:MAG: HigA family addiction module antitoxin [Rubrivivax sp.]|nr:HigA family addiction module antitoxin [Rubrivivax sp.]
MKDLPSAGAADRGLPQPRRSRPPHLSWPARRPPHPGEFLDTRFLAPLHISQTDLAAALGISRRRVNELVNGRRTITPDTAVRLAAYFGNDAAFWMHLQVAWDMHGAVHRAQMTQPALAARRPRPGRHGLPVY